MNDAILNDAVCVECEHPLGSHTAGCLDCAEAVGSHPHDDNPGWHEFRAKRFAGGSYTPDAERAAYERAMKETPRG